MRFLQQFCYLGQRAVSGTDPLFVETSFRSVQSGSVDCTVPTVRTQPAMCVADCLWSLLPEGGAIMKQVGDRIGRCAPSCGLCRRSRVGAAAAEPASLQLRTLPWKTKSRTPLGPGLFVW